MIHKYISLITLFIILLMNNVYSQDNATCLSCHSDKELEKEIGNKKISLYVEEKDFNKSVHKDLGCTDCHEGFNPDDIPHKEKITPVNCANCHEVQDFKGGLHEKNRVSCKNCHTNHSVQPAAVIKKDFTACFNCHKQSELKQFNLSTHYNKGLLCSSCHKSVHSPNKITSGSSNLLCLTCHKTDSPKLKNNIHHTKLDFSLNSKNKCTDCHNPHNAGAVGVGTSSTNCMSCHLDEKKFSKDSKLFKYIDEYNRSIHAQKNEKGKLNAKCEDCHTNNMITTSINPDSPTSKLNQPKTCGKCHIDQSGQFSTSNHGIALLGGVKSAPSCSDCHGEHLIISVKDSTSMASRKNEKELCFKCHLRDKETISRVSVSTLFIKSFEKSIHYRAFINGNQKAAVCSDCHSNHGILESSKPNSTISKFNVAKSCGKCHEKVYKDFETSSHALELEKGNIKSATCTDCHSEHEILENDNKNAIVYKTNLSTYVCAKCHGDMKFSDKFGIIGNQYSTYTDSYHGLAVSGGDKMSANCASCHNYHDIKRADDPTSSINKNNLSKTCGKCHQGANENFTKDPVHVQIAKTESPILYWVSNLYVILIILIVGGMFVHNLLDFIRKSKKKLIERRMPSSFVVESEDEDKPLIPSRLFLRMSLNERIQHAVLLISFVLLVLTGFGLTYPNSWWVLMIRSVLGDWAFLVRGWIHRISGVAMTLVSLYHIYYVFFTPRGKQLIKDLLPVKKDLTDAITMVKYLIGRSKHHPHFDRFGYIEKAEYWALIWGTIVMAITGFMLWFSKDVINVSGKFYTDLATIIHFYEAWLATLSIIVWHLYFVVFNPDVYPVNLAFLKGTISEEEMKHEHPLEYERLMQNENEKKSEE